MGLLDRIFGRKVELEPEPEPADVPPRDAAAVERYEQLLRTAPQDVLEQAHVEAFERLTPAQLDLLYERLTATATTDDERPADARPGVSPTRPPELNAANPAPSPRRSTRHKREQRRTRWWATPSSTPSSGTRSPRSHGTPGTFPTMTPRRAPSDAFDSGGKLDLGL